MHIHIVESNPYGKLKTADLETFERSLGTTLPPPYRKFLLEHNGGSIDGAAEIAEIRDFHGIHGGPEYSCLKPPSQFKYVHFPQNILPIGEDPFGNCFCILLTGNDKGAVCFWDHECSENPEDGIHLLAPDFDSFLRGVAIKVALSRNQTDIVRQVATEFGINAPIYAGYTILDLAFELADFPIIQMLASIGGSIRPDALIEAVRRNDLDSIFFVLERGIDVNYANLGTRWTALGLAKSMGLVDITELLIASGANP